jgi:hypothetical protein
VVLYLDGAAIGAWTMLIGMIEEVNIMQGKAVFTKILATLGTVLVWLPVLIPILLSIAFLASEGMFLLDYLMPAELSLLVLVGGVLLLWAALRRHARWGLIGWGLGSAVVLLLGSQGLAVATGLADGRTAIGGWQWALVLAMLIGYDIAVILTGVGGVLMLRDLFRPNLAAG